MTTTTGTETDLSGDGSNREVVPPGDESQGAGKGSGEESIPKSRFIAAINDVTRRLDAAEAEAKNLREQLAKGTEKKPPTRAELLQLVEARELTQEQADTLWEEQIVARTKRESAAESTKAVTAQERTRLVEAELSGYKELVPDVWVEGSPERDKVAKEFAHLVKLGAASTKETEAAALRAAFGDLETLRASKTAKTGPADTHSETGGSKPPAGGGNKDVLKTLSPREKEHYETKIKQGIYADWAAVKAELDFANPATRRKMGAKV